MQEPSSRPIRFVHRGRVQEVTGLPPTTTVLQWLREQSHCMGTKEGCAEGDCGACAIVVAEQDERTGELRQHNVNACIQFLPTLDGRALFTVEDVATPQGLHPCQQAMVDCHGSQCGFCTPGFVMSLWHIYERTAPDEARPSREALADALSGNLCRCTGYRPILDAAERMFDAPRIGLDPHPTLQALQSLRELNRAGQDDATFVYQTPASDGGPAQRFIAPRTLEELAAWRLALPQARLLAGSTDIGLWVNKQFKALGDILYLGQVKELQSMMLWDEDGPHGEQQTLDVGAGVSLEDAWTRLCQDLPELRELWLRFASPPVRHAGTLVGNIANGSPIGDGPVVLLALDAELVLRQGAGQRQMPLSSFYLDYMETALEPGEFIERLHIPLPPAQDKLRAYKISKRRDSDISAVCAAFRLRLQAGVISEVRLAWGGMAATARRATQTEAALLGQPWNEATLRRAQAALRQDFQPLSDLRASRDYRMTVALNLLERFWLETRPEHALPAEQVQVWPAHSKGALA